MKIRRSIWGFCIAALVVMALAIWFFKRPAKAPGESVASPQAGNVAAASTQPKVKSAGAAAGSPLPMAAVTAKAPAAAPRKSKEQQTLDILSTDNDVPIDFYGKLEDQFGNPVVDAEITGSTIIYSGTRTGSEKVTARSDASGLFQIHAGKGESLGVMPKKAGYLLATAGIGFRYSHFDQGYFVPDPNNPVIIKMWKLQGAEPLFNINQRYKFHYTDSPIYFDLLTGEIVPSGGDIKITMSRSQGIVSGRTRQDWGVAVEAVRGGLIESSGDERVTYWAPETGYQPSDSFTLSTNGSRGWSGGVDQTFFLESRNGQMYSKVNVALSINQNPDDYVWAEFHGVANTNGSRNWEGDSNTVQAQ